MNINATDELNRILDELDATIKNLESSPNRAFVLIEYETVFSFHWFNLCFKQFWDRFDHSSVSQLLQYQKFCNRQSELSVKYEKLLRDQIEYIESIIDIEGETFQYLPPVLFSEDNSTDVIGYYRERLKDATDEKGNPLFAIELDSETCFEQVDGKEVPVDAYYFRSDKLNHNYYDSLFKMYNCLKNILALMLVVCSYPNELQAGYRPNQEETIMALGYELQQYAQEIGTKVERDLKKVAQGLKPSRNASLTPEIWGHVMEEEDELFELAINGRLLDCTDKKYDAVFEDRRKLLTDNYSLLQKIQDTCLDGELFDIRLSVENHNLLSALNEENLDLFYELVLRRNIIQREMFPNELGVEYVNWLNPSEEQSVSDDKAESLNLFAPQKNLQELLKQNWFSELRTDEIYDENWTDAFIKDLMASKYSNEIASQWAVKGARDKKIQLKGYILGLLKDNNVLKGSYDSIARKVDPDDTKRTFSNYMSQGKQQTYAEWVNEYVLGTSNQPKE